MAPFTNLSFYTVPLAYCVAQAGGVYSKMTGRQVLNNREPARHLDAVMKSDKFSTITKGRILRAEAAELNSLKTLALFGPSVALAHAVGVPTETIDLLSIGYVILRCAYMIVYIWIQENPRLFVLRPATHWGSVMLAVLLYVKAAQHA